MNFTEKIENRINDIAEDISTTIFQPSLRSMYFVSRMEAKETGKKIYISGAKKGYEYGRKEILEYLFNYFGNDENFPFGFGKIQAREICMAKLEEIKMKNEADY